MANHPETFSRIRVIGGRGISPAAIILVAASGVMLAILLYVSHWLLFWGDEWLARV